MSTRHRAIVDDLRLTVGWSTPPYPTSSGFRFVFDPSVSRHLVDSSAIAQQVGVFVRAAGEQPLAVPPLIEVSDPDGLEVEEGLGVEGGTLSGGPGGSWNTSSDDGEASSQPRPGTVEKKSLVLQAEEEAARALLTVPASVAAREKAKLACRAFDNEWFAEAEELFMAGTTLTPTDSFLWFGAGLAASRVDAARAAEHLEKASRYLLPVDPAGSTYVALLAAAHWEAIDDMRSARALLKRQASELNTPCPSLSLHLARLGPDRQSRVGEALIVDPLLEPDITALGFECPEAFIERRQRTERELSLLEFSISELRKVDGGPSWPDESISDDGADDRDDLPLTKLEAELWRKVRICEAEIGTARKVVQERERTRLAKEDEVAHLAEVARHDLSHYVAVPFFVTAVAIAVAIVAAFIAGRLLASQLSPLSLPIMIVTWAVELALVALAGRQFVQAWWPHRSYRRARAAKAALPKLEWEAAQLRQSEFEVNRHFNRASQDAELRIRRVIDRRWFLIPNRPEFEPVPATAPTSPVS
ncbi:MAG: hypothetical protein GY773_23975 [Actinomycetia bacterium]|nr:hypothetical protein [Actinomycetes bacterium]